MKPSPLIAALDADSYEYLSTQSPELLSAIEAEVAAGKTPSQCARLVSQYVGPERDGLARRVYQAAAHVERMQVR